MSKGDWKKVEVKQSEATFDKPTMSVSNGKISLYGTDMKKDQMVDFYTNGKAVAFVPGKAGTRQLKENKPGTKLFLGGSRIVKSLNLKPGNYPGHPDKIKGTSGWVFDLA